MRLLWKDLLIYLSLFFVIHLIYMFGLSAAAQKDFEDLVLYFKKYENIIPLSFVLGFFVSNVMNRWWEQYHAIPWVYSVATFVSSNIQGYDEVGRAMRRTIMRYVCLCLTMVFRKLSKRVQKRFPKMSDMVDAGLLNKSELCVIETLDQKYPGYAKNW